MVEKERDLPVTLMRKHGAGRQQQALPICYL
jgi:hypothetical protein